MNVEDLSKYLRFVQRDGRWVLQCATGLNVADGDVVPCGWVDVPTAVDGSDKN